MDAVFDSNSNTPRTLPLQTGGQIVFIDGMGSLRDGNIIHTLWVVTRVSECDTRQKWPDVGAISDLFITANSSGAAPWRGVLSGHRLCIRNRVMLTEDTRPPSDFAAFDPVAYENIQTEQHQDSSTGVVRPTHRPELVRETECRGRRRPEAGDCIAMTIGCKQ